MPCSIENRIDWEKADGEIGARPRWEVIKETFAKPIENIWSLEQAIKSYNPGYAEKWTFSNFRTCFDDQDDFFEVILPKIIEIALSLPDLIKISIPLLKQGMNKPISMSQQQVACLLANAFLCTFPRRNTNMRNAEFSNYPTINFSWLFGASGRNVIEKLKCIVNYFRRVLCVEMPKNVVTFQRRSVRPQFKWLESNVKLSSTKLFISSEGKIEAARGMLQVDFANRMVGGGVLGRGCVQEEIRFVINPEMIVSRLFTECLADDEALIMIGCEQFSAYKGYASSFEFAGDFVDDTPVDKNGRRKCRIVAIDAQNYSNCKRQQYAETSILRELNKAFCGYYKGEETLPVASGLHGCGAFGGDPIRSLIIQLMACSMNERNLAIYTFGNDQVRTQIIDIYDLCCTKKITVGQLYEILVKFDSVNFQIGSPQLGQFIENEIAEIIILGESFSLKAAFINIFTQLKRKCDQLKYSKPLTTEMLLKSSINILPKV